MTTIAEIISRPIAPELKVRNKPKVEWLSGLTPGNSDVAHNHYEYLVFSFLLAKKNELGITRVAKFKALLVDGAIELSDGRLLAVEFKYRMNWGKACVAESQFRNYLKRKDRIPFPVQGGVVFFEEFSGDWAKKAQRRLLENGWSNWYRSHSEVEGYRLDLVRLRNETLEPYPLTDADAVLAMAEKLKDKERNGL